MRGDINGNGRVDVLDFRVLLSAWLTQPGVQRWNAACDISIPPIISSIRATLL
ncbi:MAG: dockerin type I domain-containing protein [Planctomycetota bacterium]